MSNWYYSKDKDHGWTGPCNSREEALLEGIGDYVGEYDVIYTGEGKLHKPKLEGYGECLVDRMIDDIWNVPFENDGPWDKWLQKISKEDIDVLNNAIKDMLEKWLTMTCNWPSWELIENIQDHNMENSYNSKDYFPKEIIVEDLDDSTKEAILKNDWKENDCDIPFIVEFKKNEIENDLRQIRQEQEKDLQEVVKVRLEMETETAEAFKLV